MNKMRILALLSVFLLVFSACKTEKNEKTSEPAGRKEETTDTDQVIHQEPPVVIRLNRDEWNLLREAEKNGESATQQYLQSIHQEEWNYAEVSSLLHVIDSLPVPSLNDSEKDVSISYYPEKSRIHFLYKLDGENHWYRFEIPLNENTIAAKKSEIMQKHEDSLLNTVIHSDEKIKLILQEDLSESPDLAKHYAEFWVEMDGYLAKVVYKNQNRDISQVRANDIVNSFWDDTQVKDQKR